GAQNEHLSQMTADLSNKEVITGPIEATAIGNALVQAIAIGEIADIGSARALIASSSMKVGTYQPTSDTVVRNQISAVRSRYQELISR
ncbi:MAG: rhamnulokinase, partial [Candidatus Planktophila sp.]